MFDITSVAVSETSTFQLRDASDNLLSVKASDGEAAKPRRKEEKEDGGGFEQ